MKFFNKPAKDERIENIQNKYYKEVYYLVVIISILSIITKSFTQGFTIWDVTTEIVLLIIPGLYYGIRMILSGVYGEQLEMMDRKRKMPMELRSIILGALLGVGFGVYFGIRSAVLYGDESTRILYFVLVFFASIMIYAPFFIFFILIPKITAKKVSNRKNREMEEEQEQW